jgi:hypothetical protein
MKSRASNFGLSAGLILIFIFSGCTKDSYFQSQNDFLKKVKYGAYIIEQISYNQNNLVSEVNSTTFYRKFSYNDDLRLIKEEIAVSPDLASSSMIPGSTHDFVDPAKTGISMYCLYEYDNNGRLATQTNYIPSDGNDKYRSKRTFEYNDNNLISKELLYNEVNEVTQFRTYLYDSDGNVTEENYYSNILITQGAAPEHISNTTYQYDSFSNPYRIFGQSGYPGIYTNKNNITKITTVNYNPAPGLPANTVSETAYEYNLSTGYPVRVKNGEEFIY